MQESNNKVFVATTNEGKLKEFMAVFEGSGIILESIGIKFNELQADDIEKISKDKAQQAFSISKKPIFVDDVGIYIDKYKNFPGLNAKQVAAGLGIDGIKRLIDEGDKAHFTVALSYMDETLESPKTFIGKTTGKLSLRFNGQEETGFPFNQFFIPDGESKFVCEIPVQERARFSHRMKAAEKLKQYLIQKNKTIINSTVL
jgi:XTP/dITP diphosphohydrolase